MTNIIEHVKQGQALSELEQSSARILNDLQKIMFRNELAILVERRLSLTPADHTSAGVSAYFAEEAYLKGQIDFITYLLQASEAASEEA